ncbi:MAG: hypothetical protein SF070_19165 [Gemmatimonadota bacterium]|nr:hypothetical protein [Gemmatimonadota bacterium]
MSRAWRILSSALVLLALTASATAAQEESARRQGFWFNIGLGYGSADFNCDNCGSTDREGSVAGNIAAGGTLSPQLLLGVESNGWYKDESGIKSTFGNLAAVAYFYPSAGSNLFLKGGVGLSAYKFENGSSVDDTGLGLLAGIGYDLPIGKSLSITPTAAFNFGMMGDKSGAQSVKINWFSLGAGLTVH